MNLKNLEYIEKNNPVTKEEIDFAEKRINGELPKVYKEFLRYANGMVMNLCVLYDTQRIVESYECNEFAEYAPGYISIGNDNGDRELIIKAEKGAVLCGFLDAAEIGSSEPEEWFNFKSWVENGCEMDEEDDTEYGNVYITKLPDEKDICAFNINGCSLPTGKYPAMCYSAADYRIKSRYFDTEDIVS